MSKKRDWDRLVSLLEQEQDLFEQILDLCRKQSELLAANRIDELDGPFNDVQELREKINGLHQESDALMQSYVSELSQGKSNATVDELAQKVREVIEKCAALNNQNMKAIEVLTTEHAKKIDEQRAKREGIGGYATTVPNNPEIFDKKT